MSDGIMIYQKLEELEEKIDALTDSLANLLDSVEERETDVDSEEEEEESGEDSLPPEQEEQEQEEPEEEVEAPKIVESGQQVSRQEMRALNTPKNPKLVPGSKKEEEKWEDEFRE